MIKNSKKSGFTLTEVLVVIAIIGLILAISIPSIISIRKRINERLYEGKKEEILVAAELYGRDKKIVSDTIIYVYTLIESKYLESEIAQNDSNCSGEHTSAGCILDPRDDSNINNEKILLKKSGNTIIAIWNGKEGSSSSAELIGSIEGKLNCTEITETTPCLFTGKNPDNYLYYSGIMWRILGIYKINGKKVVKMITDNNVVWETTA